MGEYLVKKCNNFKDVHSFRVTNWTITKYLKILICLNQTTTQLSFTTTLSSSMYLSMKFNMFDQIDLKIIESQGQER